jgi:NADH-quinone oxidoreductase subunit A
VLINKRQVNIDHRADLAFIVVPQWRANHPGYARPPEKAITESLPFDARLATLKPDREKLHNVAVGIDMDDFDLSTYYPIFAYLALLIGFAVTTLIIAHTLGPRRDTKGKQVPYESGMDPIGDARQRFDIKFYLVAIMFLVFDVELLFLYPWAVVAYQEGMIPQELSLHVFLCVLSFILLLVLAYLYDWKKGVFKWR